MFLNLIDTHCHIDLAIFDKNRQQVLQQAKDKGVSDLIIPATIATHWQKIKTLTTKYQQLHPAYGLHPMFISQHHLRDLDQLEHYLQTEKAIAVGECGLDFFIFNQQTDTQKAKATQQHFFHNQLLLAQQYKLPVIIHARKSLDLVLKEIRQYPDLTGVIHSFSGSEQQAYQLIEQGFYLGFGGPITYTRAKKLRYLIRSLPLDALLLETDAPDQPDASHYGQCNQPAFLINIAQTIAKLRGILVQEVIHKTTANSYKLFNFPSK